MSERWPWAKGEEFEGWQIEPDSGGLGLIRDFGPCESLTRRAWLWAEANERDKGLTVIIRFVPDQREMDMYFVDPQDAMCVVNTIAQAQGGWLPELTWKDDP